MSVPTIPRTLQDAYAALAADLRAVFGPRLEAVVAFGPRIRSALGSLREPEAVPGDALALVDRVTVDDLGVCTAHADRWRRSGLRVPLLLGRDEFLRSLDAFPLEYDDILAHHVVVFGTAPFDGVSVRPDDLRRACETRAKGHLVHLREGYIESSGRAVEVGNLILASASPFSALLGNIARLRGLPDHTPATRAAAVADIANLPPGTVERVLALEADPVLGGDEAIKLYPEYLATVERLVAYVDGWSRS